MRGLNIIYNYYPRYREPIFSALKKLHEKINFIYGRNSWQNVACLVDEKDDVRRNIFIGNLTFQTFGFSTLAQICRNDTIVIGDIRFLNAWIYSILGRIFRRRIFFWTHGVLQQEGGLKWWLRRAFYKLSNGLMLYSQHEADLLREMGYNKPLIVVGNSNYSDSDLDQIKAADKRSDFERDDNICYIGRISLEKGVKEFARFAETHPNKRVVLVGPTTMDCEPYKQRFPNLEFLPPEYEIDQLRKVTEGCGTLVMFTAAGLSLFTAIILDKKVAIKRTFPQKPEYHLLQQYGLVSMFDDYDEMLQLLASPPLSEIEFQEARAKFFTENSGEKVAQRIVQGLF